MLRKFLAEIRRRKVFRAAVAYSVVAWVVIQIADITFEPLHLPGWALTLLIALAIAGLPLAVVLAWLFDLTPAGLERDRGDAGNSASQSPPPDASIAVLPFTDLSAEGDQAYFCEGVAEEILNTLMRVDGLKVAARRSTMPYARTGGRSTADFSEIGAALNVATVLEGSVRKEGNKLRISAQLIDTADGNHRWTHRYEREMSDVFAVQDQIAENIARVMQLTLQPQDRCIAQRAGTSDIEAYDLFLKGQSFFHRWGARNLRYAAELFESALAKDPEYARAWAGLADANAMQYIYFDSQVEYRNRARDASKQALGLCPNLPDAHVSRGMSCSMFGNWREAEQHFQDALALDPDHFEALYFYARVCVHQGELERAITLFEQAAAARLSDYQAPLLLQQLYKRLGRMDEARAIARQGIARAEHHLESNPDDARALYLMSGALADLGETQRGEQLLLRAMATDPTEAAVLYNAACFYARIGDADRAVELLEQVRLPRMAAEWARNDPDLDTLRGNPRFDALYPPGDSTN
ncbi:MAG: tetratricopeptide repeat protein [Gammaproteobacteria bacterium]|nr:tetratricopeptide repeat protein [Gammaproteobacteria bacterium]NNF60899.1 tetratricopeptide repeat protein [Gammaproteobacteria bacterium]NNM20518.1 tetratricopeptide repeat protein [Gammaproteobacteria bacterium]